MIAVNFELLAMENKNFNEVLDYGIFKDDDTSSEIDASQIPQDVDWDKYKYFTKVKTHEGKVLLFRSLFSSVRPNYGDIGFLDGKRISGGKYPLTNGGWIILVENGFLSKWLRIEKYQDKKKKFDLEVETIFPYGVQVGNNVYKNGEKAPTGAYQIGRFKELFVKSGKVVARNPFDPVEIRPGRNYRIFYFTLGLACFAFGLAFYPQSDFTNVNVMFSFLLSLILLTFGGLAIFHSLFFKIVFEKELIKSGSFPLYQKLFIDDVWGFLTYDEKGMYGMVEKIVLIKKGGKKRFFDSKTYGRNFPKVLKEVESNFKKLSSNHKKWYFNEKKV